MKIWVCYCLYCYVFSPSMNAKGNKREIVSNTNWFYHMQIPIQISFVETIMNCLYCYKCTSNNIKSNK